MDAWDRWDWLTRMRPMFLSGGILRHFAPTDRRQIITTSNGLKLYADPLSALGQVLRKTDTYEPEVTALFQRLIRPGMRILDVGANEGYYSALAGRLCGPEGYVVAVEPQKRLRDIIEINARLNGVTWIRAFDNGFGGEEGTDGTLNLYPVLNNGAASVVSSHRFSWRTQPFKFVSFNTVLAAAGAPRFDLVKVDVEGYEVEVVQHLRPHLEKGQVVRLLLDYHEGILGRRHIDPRSLHEDLLRAGMRVEEGDPSRLSSYLLYAFEPR